MSDFRHAWRSLARRPSLSMVAVAVLALAIGAATAMFSVVDAVLLRPLPFADPDHLVVVWERSPERGIPFVEVSHPDYLDWKARSRTVADFAIMPAVSSAFLLGGEEPARVQGRLVSGGFFDLLGARALLGRTLSPDDDRAGAARVMVISHGLWQRHFGGDPQVIGRGLVVDGTPMTVVGVMPAAFRYPQGVELWTPVVPAIPQAVANRNVGWAIVVGRLAAGATLEQAGVEMDAIVAGLSRAHHPGADIHAAVVTPLAEHLFGPTRTALGILLGAVLLVLLVACANVSVLLLVRAAARQREIAVRLALGASRSRLVRALLAEGGLIALAGGVGGMLIAVWGVPLLVALVPAEVPRLADASVDARVLAFATLLTAASALAAGLAPAVIASRPSLTDALAEGSRAHGVSPSHRRLQSLLLGGEAAVALVLLAGAGLLVQTFQNLRRVDLGYDPQRLLTLEVSHPRNKYRRPVERRELYGALVDRVDALPGVEASAMVLLRPLFGEVGLDWPFRVEGQSEEEGRRNPALNLEVVTPDYFRVMRIPLLRGRGFDSRDTAGAPLAAVVSRTLAERYWPGQDPIGKRLEMPLPTAPYPLGWVTVVGVVGDARYRELQQARLDIYLSHLQSDEPMHHVVVRTAGDPLESAAAVRTVVRALDRDLVVSEMAGMEGLVDRALAGARFGTQVLSGFAAAALLLATLGTYGMVAFAMGQRTREIGVRMALGARPSAVAALVVRQGLAPVVAGLALGVAGALALGRTLASLLFEVAPTDPASLGLAAAVLATSALGACTLPAVRAARIDPARALRED